MDKTGEHFDLQSARGDSGARGNGLVHLWIRLCLFLIPAILVVGVPVYAVDPYGLFPRDSIVADNVRLENAARVNQLLQSIVSFSRNPKPNILLGDSQMALFSAREITALTHRPFSNLSFGGGTLAESIATFWYAARTVPLQRVYFGMSFYSFTDNSRNRVSAAEHIVKHPLAYFADGDVLEATWDDLLMGLLHEPINYGPTVGAGTFWREQLTQLERRKSSYSASERTLTQIAAIVRYCREHGIDLVFVIPPQHEDVRRGIRALGMQDSYADFKARVTALGKTYDCDTANEATLNADNFQDPFHMTRAAATRVTQSIWTGKSDLCTPVGPATPGV